MIIEGTEDYIGLWEVIREIKLSFPHANRQDIKAMTLESIREILETKFMAIGMFKVIDGNNWEYQIWNLDIDRIINRIEIEWNELEREPNIGDIAWLITTKEGEKEANIINKKWKR